MRVILIFLLFATVCSSCVTQKKCNRKFPASISIKDSSYTQTKIEYRDTTIYTPADTVTLRDTINCDELGRVNMPERTVRSNNASVTVGILNNELNVTANCDSLEIELQKIREIQTSENKHIYKEVQIKKEQYIPSFYQFCFWWFWITAGGISLFLLFKYALKSIKPF